MDQEILSDNNSQLDQDFELEPGYLLNIDKALEEQQLQDIINTYDQEQCVQEGDINQILIGLRIDETSRLNLKLCLEYYTRLLILGQELTQLFGIDEVHMQKAIQLSKLSIIGNMQIQQTIWIINTINNPQMLVSIMKKYSVLNKYSILTENINLTSMNQLIDYQLKEIFSPLEIQCQNFFKPGAINQKQKPFVRELKILLSKLTTIIEMYPYALRTHQEDLFCLDRSHQDWQSMYVKVLFKNLGTQENLKKSYDQVLLGVMAANAMVHKSLEYKNDTLKGIVEGFGAIYYMINTKKGKDRADEFISDPAQDQAFKVWNLGEQGMMKRIMPLIFQNIKYNKKIYIKRMFPLITKDFIMQQYKDNCINKITPMNIEVKGLDLPSIKELFQESPGRVCVRLLCHELLQEEKYSQQVDLDSPQKSNNYLQNKFNKIFQKPPCKDFDKIIIHIHGGGFVSMSSRSHQTYTRKWANSLQVPIFSLDYRKAPDDPYPAGLDDCWQAYQWIINFSHCYFNINPKQVVLVGDSAGGNLVAALTILCIKFGVRAPDGLLLAYPALNLQRNCFSPSLLIALNDGCIHSSLYKILPHTILRLCLESYINDIDFDPEKDPLLSPNMASQEILKLFPRTRIMAGTNDPLHDESWRLGQKLVKLQKDFSMIIYSGMPHGFLSFDTPHGMKECKVTVEDAANLLSSLLTQTDYLTQIKEYENGKHDIYQS